MSTEEVQTVGGVSVEKLTKTYIKIREAKAALKAAFDKEEESLQEKLDIIKRALLDYCKQHGVESVRTSEGIFYRSTKTRYWTNDWDSMNRFILEHEVPEFYEKRLNQTTVKQFLEENPDVLPPGLNMDSEYVITVRKK
jgi:hypothetical protein